jgi:L,D-transpeptidase YcbB
MLNRVFTEVADGVGYWRDWGFSVLRHNLLRCVCSAAAFVVLAASTFAQEQTASITSIAPSLAISGKLATRTEIVAERQEAAIVTQGSIAALEDAIQKYSEIVAGGGWPMLTKGKYDKTVTNPRIVLLRQRLVSEGYLPFDGLTVENPEKFDADLSQALAEFQRTHGIASSGKMDERTRAELNISAEARLYTLRENYPRVGAYLQNLGSRNILVNIPSAQLETVEFGKVIARHNVVVGKLDRPTPILESKVSDINFNPHWTAPASIVAKDLIPKYKKDPTIFDQMRIKIFDGIDGPEIDPQMVDWDNTAPDRYVFRQDSGGDNALGIAKINFPNKFMVYMHDTPHRELFSGNARYESSGCVRVDQVDKLVQWILEAQGGMDEVQMAMITDSGENYAMKVETGPDIRFMYLTAWATEDGIVNFRPDIYRLDGTGFVDGQPEPQGNM